MVFEITGNWANMAADAESLTKFIHKLGVPSKWQFVDVVGLDEDGLAMLPKPCKGTSLSASIRPSKALYWFLMPLI
jgi:hypothetical protein